MKLTDYLAQYLASLGVKKTFGITGSAIAPVFDSFAANKDIEMICVQHEQAAAMAADAYARVSEGLGVAISTSGPGATNLITGICCSWFDHIPTLYITGQVNSRFTKGDLPIKQVGFQETDIVSMVKPVTKYAVMVTDPNKIKYELDKAVHIALSGRPGPVLIDLPMDLQKAEVTLKDLVGYREHEKDVEKLEEGKSVTAKIEEFIKDLKAAERPVVLIGGGVVHANAQEELKELLKVLKVPTVVTWVAIDVLEETHPLYRGRIGTYGQRGANFTFQNADLVLSLGSRHDGRQTGGMVESFARAAKRYVIDIDRNELTYQQVKGHVNINVNLKDFIPVLTKKLQKENLTSISWWLKRTKEWQEKYPIVTEAMRSPKKRADGYAFMDVLSDLTEPNDVIVGDCGGNIVNLAQAYKVKKGQKIVTAWAHSPMGYAFAASLGAYYGKSKKAKNVLCTIGDGGMQVNIQELQTVKYYDIPLKVFIMDNESYGIIKQFQDTYFKSRYVGSHGLGYGVPDFVKVAKAYGLKTELIKNYGELKSKIKKVLNAKGPVICVVKLPTKTVLEPRLGWNTGIEDQMPFLDREEFTNNMYIKPLVNKEAETKNLP